MWERLRKKPRSYWLTSALILAAILAAGPVVDRRLDLEDAKDALFMLLTKSVTNPSIAHNAKLVWIGDDEYWGPELQHRSPTNRHYLAKLIRAADAADASVVALDFDLRLSQPAEAVKPGDFDVIDREYREETDDLATAIGQVARRRRIVLAKIIEGPVGGPFTLVADALQPYGICTKLIGDGRWANPGARGFVLDRIARANISCGYIALMPDKREVPPPARIVGQLATLDSFPLAIARARDPSVPGRYAHGHFYASYIPQAAIESATMSLPASALRHDPRAAAAFVQGYPVLIGAAWHLRAKGQGELTDVHETPIGEVAGTLLHANLLEAVMSGRTYPALPHEALIAIEIVLGIAAAIVFALAASPLVAALVLVAAMPVLLLIQWLSLQLFGTFLDLFAPTIGLGLHAVADRLFGKHKPH